MTSAWRMGTTAVTWGILAIDCSAEDVMILERTGGRVVEPLLAGVRSGRRHGDAGERPSVRDLVEHAGTPGCGDGNECGQE